MRAPIRRSLVLARRRTYIAAVHAVYCGWAGMSLALNISRGGGALMWPRGPGNGDDDDDEYVENAGRNRTGCPWRSPIFPFRSSSSRRSSARTMLASFPVSLPTMSPDDLPSFLRPSAFRVTLLALVARLILPFWSCRFCAFVGKRQSAGPAARVGGFLLLGHYYRFPYADIVLRLSETATLKYITGFYADFIVYCPISVHV